MPPWQIEAFAVQSTPWFGEAASRCARRAATMMLLKIEERFVKAVISPRLGRRSFRQQVLLRMTAPLDLKTEMQLPSLL